MIRIKDSNLEYPIVIWSEKFLENNEEKEDEHVVDGLHRISKAYIENVEYIDVIFLENEDIKIYLLMK